MRPKAIRDLAQLSDEDLFICIAEGLDLVIKNSRRLNAGYTVLAEAKQYQASRLIAAVAEEEATKFLILVDAVRCPRKKCEQFSVQLSRFNDHLAKGLYARACGMRAPTMEQLQGYLDLFRQEFYLDGPNDVDWIFYNDVLQQREGVLYVDYVATDDGHYWSDPGQFEEIKDIGLMEPCSLKMAEALFKVGVASTDGLRTIADVWRGLLINRETHWSELRQFNIQTLEELEKHGLLQDQSNETLKLVVNEWSFPMYDLDLRMMPVKLEDLRQRQLAWNPGW